LIVDVLDLHNVSQKERVRVPVGRADGVRSGATATETGAGAKQSKYGEC